CINRLVNEHVADFPAVRSLHMQLRTTHHRAAEVEEQTPELALAGRWHRLSLQARPRRRGGVHWRMRNIFTGVHTKDVPRVDCVRRGLSLSRSQQTRRQDVFFLKQGNASRL